MKSPKSRKNSVILNHKSFLYDLKLLFPENSIYSEKFLNNLTDGRWVWDLENIKYKWSNKKFWNTLGYSKNRDHSLSFWCNLLNAEDFNKCIMLHKKCEDNNDFVFDTIIGFKNQIGVVQQFRMLGTTVTFEDIEPPRKFLVGSYTDLKNFHITIKEN